MGYTHYFSFKAPKRAKGEAERVEKSYKTAIKHCQKIIQTYSKVNGGIAGYTAHSKLMQYGGVVCNGKTGEDCEDFVLREHYMQNLEDRFGEFCKTGQNPYDVLVVACLIVLKHYLCDNIAIDSDGTKTDWSEGLLLARKITGLKSLKIPANIRPGSLRIVG